MAPTTYREAQLLKAFRAADDRGKHAIEQLARQQAEYGQQQAQPSPQKDNVVLLHG